MLRYVPTLLVLGFAIYCVIDVARSPGDEVRGLPRLLWLVLVVLIPVLGGLAWLIAGRPRDPRPPGSSPPRPRSVPPTRGPDDDPDFLRSLDEPKDKPRKGDDSGEGTAEGDRLQ